MIARYLLKTPVSNHCHLNWRLDNLSDSPSHDGGNESETTTNFEKLGSICKTLWSRIISNLVVRCCNETEEDDQSEEDNDEGQVGSEGAQQKDEADKGHDDGVMSLGGIPRLAKSTFCAIGADESVGRIAGVCLIDPMAPIDDEHDEREGVAQDEFGDAGNVHGNAAHEIPGAASSDQRSRIGALELEETPHCCLEGDQEADDAEQSRITWICWSAYGPELACSIHVPNRLARSPFALSGWKKSLSY